MKLHAFMSNHPYECLLLPRISIPHGTDYFELKEINDRNLKFFYETDVDSIDFNEFRTEKYLRSIELVP